MMVENKLLVKGTPYPPLDREFTVIGKPLNRRDAVEKVTGRAQYSGEIKLPNMLHGKILSCPHPRARIVKIDTSKAEALPGVKAILTKDNTPKDWRTYWYQAPQLAFPECITYEGQEVAAVAAEDIETAQKALELIEVKYEILTPTLDAEKALTLPPPERVADEDYPGPTSKLLQMGSGSGVYGALRPHVGNREESIIQRGDVKKGFDDADIIVEDTYTTQAQYHGTIQTRVCVASWDGHDLTVWDSTQGVWNSKLALAFSLGLDPANVRVIVKYLGGGFGSKAWAQRITYYAAKLSMITGRPVRIELTRGEEFLRHPRRPSCKTYIKMGAKKDGKLTAIYQKTIVNVGAVTFYRPIFVIWHTSQLYTCPNVYLEEHAVWTNLQVTGPQRSPLNMAGIFALESHVERLSEELGIDPYEFRLKNYTNYGNQEKQIPYSSKKLDECMKLVTDTIGWKTRKRLRNSKDGAKRRGIGMAAAVTPQGAGYAPFDANADVVIKNDGSITLYVGIVDIGAGQQTIFSMIAAEELGVQLDDITTVYGDTKDTRYAPSCQGSRVTAEVGPAVLQAAADARQKLFQLTAPLLNAKIENIRSKNGKIYVKTNPDRSIDFKTACEKINPDNPVKGSGSRAPNPPTPLFATFGAQTAEVEVDVETGEVKVLRLAAAHDFGRAINPKFCVSQIYGGIEFGLGYALLEEGIFDPKTGKLLNTNLHQYTMPTSLDMPQIDAFIVEGEDPYFAYSAKGTGEVTNAPTPAAIRNAIHDAIGIWLNDLPITPNKILTAINKKNERSEKIVIRTA